jgi:competence protein ComEA
MSVVRAYGRGMCPRPGSQSDAVSRRLELLSAELSGAWPPPDLHTHVRPAEPPEPPGPDPDQEPVVLVTELPRPGRHAARRRPPVLSSRLLPAGWEGRVALGPGPVAVLAVLVAVGLAVCCWWLVRGGPEPVAEPLASAGLATPVAVGSSAGVPPTELVVDVAGKVRRPGIAVLEPGARVIDAIRAAGGPRKGVALSGLNLARLLVDGEQILVGVAPAPGVAASAATGAPGAPGGLISINTATAGQLEELPGVGPVTAESIIAFRTEHGAFSSVEELLDVSGIGEATLAEIAPHVTL